MSPSDDCAEFPSDVQQLPLITRESVPYASHYCEENVYKFIERLYSDTNIEENENLKVYAVLISNEQKKTLVWMQRLNVDDDDDPIVWDYHVVVLITSSDLATQLVFDYDSVLPYPSHSAEYIMKSFRPQLRLRPEFQQLFRVIPGREYLAKFSSDRSHMVSSSASPPTWPLICGESALTPMELPSLWSMSRNEISNPQTNSIGKIMGVRELLILAKTGEY
jgi:hypothetical protein